MQGSTRRFQAFLDRKVFVTPMLEKTRDYLDQCLTEWILDMKKKTSGEEYDPSTLTANLGGVGKHF